MPAGAHDDNKSGQPKALVYLFLTEMWERFGFYITQGLLVLFITEFFGFSDKKGFVISGLFAGLVYIAGIIGGYIADRFLGYKTTIIWGGLFLILGYALVALATHPDFLYMGLSTVIVGNGLLKPNISSLLGTQYDSSNTKKRDSGFTIFYMGINIGAAISGVSGYIREYFGWQAAFACASLGMVIGMIIFASSLNKIKTQSQKARRPLSILIFLILCLIGLTLLFHASNNADWILPAAGILLTIYLVILTFQQHVTHRKNMLLLITLIIFSIVFWMLFFQLFIATNLFVERVVQKNLFGIELNTTIFYASESIFVILLAPFLAWLWSTLGRHNKNPSPFTKFTGGLIFCGLSFVVLSVSTKFPSDASLINPLWVFFAYFLLTVGEMLLSPIGLAAVTLLAPKELAGFMMGTWFVATGFGGIFAGMIAQIAAIPASVQTLADKLTIYHYAFLDYAYIAFAGAFILFLISLALSAKQRL